MKKAKKNLYTLLLLVTCFVASPFIFHQIWKNAKEAKRTPEVPPPVVQQQNDPVPPVQDEGEAPDANEGAVPVEATTAAPDGSPEASQETAPAENTVLYDYVTSDASYFDDALFIGDSRTVGIQEYGTLKNADYFCDVGLSASQIDEAEIGGRTFDQVIDDKQYGKIYVMLGVNEVGNDYEFTVTKFRALIEKLKVHQPDAVIYIQGNLHVSASAETNIINNAAIDYLNSRFAQLADYKKVFYIDVNPLYDDEYGYFNAAYTDDGVHPFGQYYVQWCDWLCTMTVPASADTDTNEASPEA
ncbi:MAG: hypothetical protein IJ071_09135 [Ruminococcus sp.]|nr:hypothetical protein [Ruminococcus sp.]